MVLWALGIVIAVHSGALQQRRTKAYHYESCTQAFQLQHIHSGFMSRPVDRNILFYKNNVYKFTSTTYIVLLWDGVQ